MTPFLYLNGGDHLPLEKDHFKGDRLTTLKPMKLNSSAGLGGHIVCLFNSDQGGHLSPPSL